MITRISVIVLGFSIACQTAVAMADSLGSATFSVHWEPQDAEPKARIEYREGTVPLAVGADASTFTGSYDPGQSLSYSDVNLVVEFDPEHSALVPLRIRPKLSVAATVYRVDVKSCVAKDLSWVDKRSDDPKIALRAFLTAEKALNLVGPNGCGPAMQKAMAKAWFDRSYELVTLKCYFRLSDRAADAYRAFDQSYVQKYETQDRGCAFKLVNDWKLEELQRGTSGSRALAMGINSELVAKLRGDEALAETLARTQRLTIDSIRKDTPIMPLPTMKPF